MARSVTPSLTSRFTQLVGAADDAAHQRLLGALARQSTLASPAPRNATVRSSRSASYPQSIARSRMG